MNLTVEEEWLVLGCRDSYRSCCCFPFLGPGAEKREEEASERPHLCLKGANRQGQRAGLAADALH